MELKDVILSTLEEMENVNETSVPQEPKKNDFKLSNEESDIMEIKKETIDDEEKFLKSVKERMLVLFEGFQSPNNKQIEAKVDLTLNFLEYLLATIDSRLKNIKE